jgi:uncharacterized protein YbcV (DUF1398 family)
LSPSQPSRADQATVPIDAPTFFLCLLAQHLHLNERFGQHQWQPCRVSSVEAEGRVYDRYELWFDSPRALDVWFDITDSVARWAPERAARKAQNGQADEVGRASASPARVAAAAANDSCIEGALPMSPASTPPLILKAAHGSHDGRLHFGEVIELLMRADVESYHADYRSRRTTYYLPDGATFNVELPSIDVLIADVFDAAAVRAAIAGAQQGRVMYPEFKQLTMQAGCVGYIVWIAGRHVSYFGRRGEVHVELLPR